MSFWGYVDGTITFSQNIGMDAQAKGIEKTSKAFLKRVRGSEGGLSLHSKLCEGKNASCYTEGAKLEFQTNVITTLYGSLRDVDYMPEEEGFDNMLDLLEESLLNLFERLWSSGTCVEDIIIKYREGKDLYFIYDVEYDYDERKIELKTKYDEEND